MNVFISFPSVRAIPVGADDQLLHDGHVLGLQLDQHGDLGMEAHLPVILSSRAATVARP